MKNYLLIYIILFVNAIIYGQADIKLSSFYLNPLYYNPSYAGSYEGFTVNSIYSTQWLGFEGAPKTFMINGHGTFFNSNTGLGFEIINDQVGATSDSKILGNYSYHIKLNDEWGLGLGIKAGISNYAVDYGKLNIQNPNEIYNSNEKSTWTNFNIGSGFFLYNSDFSIGLGIPNIIENTYIDLYNNKKSITSTNYYLTTAYKIKIDNDIYLQPNMLLRGAKGAPLNFLFASNLIWNEKFYASLNLDINTSFGAFVGFRFLEKYFIGYSYDTSINSFSNQAGIHSFFLNFRFEDYWKRERCGCYTF
jgi:type IX secretion system PorP/SprF family membrane protein